MNGLEGKSASIGIDPRGGKEVVGGGRGGVTSGGSNNPKSLMISGEKQHQNSIKTASILLKDNLVVTAK